MKYRDFIIFLSFLLFAGGCATAPVKGKKENSLKDLCDKNGIEWQWDSVSQVVTLNYQGLQAKAMAGSNLVIINNEQIFLSMPLKRKRDVIFVPPDFEPRVIERLKGLSYDYGVKKFKLIMIDPGHGGKDPGAIGKSGLQEKEAVLDIAQRLKKLLEAAGVKVMMTRKDDTFISLQERTEIASRSRADLFISIHANASPVRSVHGVEAYCLKDLGTLEKNEAQRRMNHRLMFQNLSMKKGSLSLEDIVADMLYTHKQSVSPSLAVNLVDRVAQRAKTQDRGEKQSRFFVLRNTLIPAVLVEIGFVTNPKEGRLLKTSDYRQKIAEGLANGILGYGDGR